MAIRITKKPIIAEDIDFGLGTTVQQRDVGGAGPEDVTYNRVNAGLIPTLVSNIQADLDARYTKEEATANFAKLAGDDTQTFKVADATLDSHAINRGNMNTAISDELSEYTLKTNVLQKDNLVAYTPTSNYHPATKKYIDDKVISAGAGDMVKAVYDDEDNGIVNEARLLGNTAITAILSNKGIVTDCDSATTIGSWEGENITNAPETGKGLLTVSNGATKNIVVQIYTAISSELIYSRMYDGTSWSTWGGQGTQVTVIDVLNSTSTEDALSANQGRVLAEQISTVSNTNVPVGGIIMYDGSFAAIPNNWNICDGSNGTPNLTARFIRGTSVEGDVGNTGGSDDASMPTHTHTGKSHAHSGPSHTHSGPSHTHSGPSHVHSIYHNHGSVTSSSSGAHTHNLEMKQQLAVGPDLHGPSSTGTASGGYLSTDGAHTHTTDLPAYSGNSGYGGTGNTGSSGTGDTGSGGTGLTGSGGNGDTGETGSNGDNKPAYYTLAYIKRIS